MDIRNIKEKAPSVEHGLYLEKIYDLQKELMEGYIGKIEKDLPMYPIDVNSRKGQAVLKDMSARVIEEIGEGYESTGYALNLLDKYGFNLSIFSEEDHKMLLNHLQNSNEEQADAIAFFVELLLYCNILPEDIYDYVEKVVLQKYKPEPPIRFVHNLHSLMKIGVGLLKRRFDDLTVGVYLVLAQNDFDTLEEYDHVVSYTPGYNNLSWAFHDNEAKLAWEVTYHLSVARNFLKNKPWKQTGVMTDEKALQSEIVLAFIEYLGYLKYCGFDAESLYVLRFKKHRVNQFRQKSNY